MIQEIGQAYDNHYVACEAAGADYVLHYRERGCLVHVTSHGGADAWAEGNAFDLPRVRDLDERPSRLVYAFAIGGARFFLVLDDEVAAPAGFAYEAVNWLRYAEPAELLFAVVTGSQLDRWYRDNRFCSRCGHPTELGPAAGRSCARSAPRSSTPRSAPA